MEILFFIIITALFVVSVTIFFSSWIRWLAWRRASVLAVSLADLEASLKVCSSRFCAFCIKVCTLALICSPADKLLAEFDGFTGPKSDAAVKLALPASKTQSCAKIGALGAIRTVKIRTVIGTVSIRLIVRRFLILCRTIFDS